MNHQLLDAIKEEFYDEEARRQYSEELLDAALALQIKTLRQQRGWTQDELAKRASLGQSQISGMEQIDHSPKTVSTLRKLAQAFDVALVIRFESFGRFLRETARVDRDYLTRPSFADDPDFSAGAPGFPRVVNILDYYKEQHTSTVTSNNAGPREAYLSSVSNG